MWPSQPHHPPQPTQGSDSSESLAEMPFEPYTDDPANAVDQTNAHVEPTHQVGLRSTQWRQTLDDWIPWSRRAQDDETLPLLSGEPQCPKRPCQKRLLRGLLRALIAFFVML